MFAVDMAAADDGRWDLMFNKLKCTVNRVTGWRRGPALPQLKSWAASRFSRAEMTGFGVGHAFPSSAITRTADEGAAAPGPVVEAHEAIGSTATTTVLRDF